MTIQVVEDRQPEQLELFEMVKPKGNVNGSIEEAFNAFHEANPHVLRNLKVLAFQALRAGRKKIGIGFLFERLRWEYMIRVNHPEDGYKLNNNFRSRYARILMETEPELDGLFDLRELKSVGGKRRKIVTVGR